MPKKSTGETPFCLMYGSEAVDPAEIAVSTHRLRRFSTETKNDERCLELDLINKKCWASKETHATIRLEQHDTTIVKSLLTIFLWGNGVKTE